MHLILSFLIVPFSSIDGDRKKTEHLSMPELGIKAIDTVTTSEPVFWNRNSEEYGNGRLTQQNRKTCQFPVLFFLLDSGSRIRARWVSVKEPFFYLIFDKLYCRQPYLLATDSEIKFPVRIQICYTVCCIYS